MASVEAEVFSINAASARVLQKAGFEPCGPGLEPGATRYRRDRAAQPAVAADRLRQTADRRYREMDMKRVTLALGAVLLAAACAAQRPPASRTPADDGSKPVGTKLLRDVDASPRTFLIAKNGGRGLGDYSVQVDGKYVWPPAGEGCDRLIACCSDLSARSPEISLSCQLAIGRDGACPLAQETVQQIAREQALTLPPACAR